MLAFWVIDEASAQSTTALAATRGSRRATLALVPPALDKENPP
jgi:hypothetical protein